MQPIKTTLTQLLDVTSPIVSAPMGYSWSADLASAVSKAGGFGMMGAAFDSSETLRTNIGRVRKALDVPAGQRLPIGVGLVGWVLDKTEVSEDRRIPTVLDALPTAIYFAFGEDLGRYVAQVRAHEAQKADKTLVIVCVNTVEEAVRAANEWKVDVIVAQGIEAGGHGSIHAPPVSILVTAILKALPHGPPIVAAGGIATGAQVASLLTLGAAGVLLGTRLLFTEECQYTPVQKALIQSAGLHSTTQGACYDEVMGMKWPSGIVGHAVTNEVWRDNLEGLPVEERKRRYDEGKEKGETDRVIAWAGKAVGLTSEFKPAAEVVAQIHDEAVRTLQKVSSLL